MTEEPGAADHHGAPLEKRQRGGLRRDPRHSIAAFHKAPRLEGEPRRAGLRRRERVVPGARRQGVHAGEGGRHDHPGMRLAIGDPVD